MIPGGVVNNAPCSCVPGFRLLVCSLKMHCILSTLWRCLFTLFLLSLNLPRCIPHFNTILVQ
ncbi:uncharacterized protein N7479_005582 [Penicillium vulpinum]|uniref:uncharacterized protein n=1 Tax=Penicillium vulpinum TaxID=29845 RepID=UPI002546E39D|nr:uncharacterized protein N7479_005582 [Penicillium vulpinum]KAJ5958432.1 hypothetical protein N7479_005582 [Penicillium vulpinum]